MQWERGHRFGLVANERRKSRMKCDRCGKVFTPGNRPDGVPNGVGFMLRNGKQITVCADCVEAVGKGDKAAKKWLDRIAREK